MDTAYVLINCVLGKEEEIIQNLRNIDAIKEIHGTFGAYDIIAKVQHAQKNKLEETIVWNIRRIQHVRDTITLMGIEGQN